MARSSDAIGASPKNAGCGGSRRGSVQTQHWKKVYSNPRSLRTGAPSLRRENLNSQTGSTLRGVAQQVRAGRGRDFEDVKRHRDERVVADKPGKIHDALVAPTRAHPFIDVV